MRRGRILIFLILIVVVGLGLVALLWTQFGNPTVAQPTPAVLTEVFYAAQNIPQGTTITPEMLGRFSIPPENVAEVMFTASEESALVGQTARLTLDQGTLITSSMVGSGPVEISGPSWAVQIPTGMVAVTIPTNRLALGGYAVNDGAHVNLNACMLFVDVDPAFQAALPNYTSVLTGTGFLEGSLPVLSVAATTNELPSRQGRIELDPTLQHFQKVRNFIFELRPMMLDDLGLVPTVRRYVDAFKEQTGLDISVTVTGSERRLEPYVEVMLFRAIQELLGNAARHSQASMVRILLDMGQERVRVSVDDNGKGFDPEILQQNNSLGLRLIRERAEMLGGNFEVDSNIGKGTRVSFGVPARS